MQMIQNLTDISHNTSVRKLKPKFIVVHATADDGATAKNEIDYFNKETTTRASADIFCDENIYFYNVGISHRYCWAVGGKRLKSCGGSLYGYCKNSNSISIEMCCYKDSSGKWCIKDETYNSTVYVIKYLMKKYDIHAQNVIRHYDVTGKICPCVYGFIAENGSDSIWQKMKKDIASGADPEPEQPKTPATPTKATTCKLVIDGIMGKNTVKSTQHFFGTPEDGVISGQYVGFKNLHKGITSIEYGNGDGGSAMVKALQTWLGITPSGQLGQHTIRAWQRKMGTPMDGSISLPSLLIKAWQKFLNGENA